MSEESKPNRLSKTRDALLAQGEDTGELFPDSKSTILLHKDNSISRRPTRPSVYLWLSCEGWMRFGPFEWLRFDDERQAILGPDGEARRKVARLGILQSDDHNDGDPPHPKSESHPWESR